MNPRSVFTNIRSSGQDASLTAPCSTLVFASISLLLSSSLPTHDLNYVCKWTSAMSAFYKALPFACRSHAVCWLYCLCAGMHACLLGTNCSVCVCVCVRVVFAWQEHHTGLQEVVWHSGWSGVGWGSEGTNHSGNFSAQTTGRDGSLAATLARPLSFFSPPLSLSLLISPFSKYLLISSSSVSFLLTSLVVFFTFSLLNLSSFSLRSLSPSHAHAISLFSLFLYFSTFFICSFLFVCVPFFLLLNLSPSIPHWLGCQVPKTNLLWFTVQKPRFSPESVFMNQPDKEICFGARTERFVFV